MKRNGAEGKARMEKKQGLEARWSSVKGTGWLRAGVRPTAETELLCLVHAAAEGSQEHRGCNYMSSEAVRPATHGTHSLARHSSAQQPTATRNRNGTADKTAKHSMTQTAQQRVRTA